MFKNWNVITTLYEKKGNKYNEETKIRKYIQYDVTTEKKMVKYEMEIMNVVTKMK